MESTTNRRVVVLDSGGIIRTRNLTVFGEAELWTVDEVLKEIRDETTRQTLASNVIPLKTREPPPDAIKAVSDFARKTGDFYSLSITDIKVIALNYTFERELNKGVSHLRTEPNTKVKPPNPKKKVSNENKDTKEVAEDKKLDNVTDTSSTTSSVVDPLIDSMNTISLNTSDVTIEPHLNTVNNTSSTTTIETKLNIERDNNTSSTTTIEKDNNTTPSNRTTKTTQGSNEDEIGWITPENIAEVTAKHKGEFETATTKKVGCVTTDFAMQNVIIQMGMNLISVDGMAIKKLKQWILKCHSCNKVTKDMSKLFCPHCGNTTLLKLPVTINADGTIKYHPNYKAKITTRGSKYPLPPPKGGREHTDLILSEDEYNRVSKLHRTKNNSIDAFDPEYSFASNKSTKNDNVVVGYGKKNPNISRKKIGKKNKGKVVL